MSFVTYGHFTAYVDAFDPDMPVVEIKMTSPVYTDGKDNWRTELESEMKTLEKGVRSYIADVKALRDEEKRYAV